MQIEGTVALITGAEGLLGSAFTEALVDRGCMVHPWDMEDMDVYSALSVMNAIVKIPTDINIDILINCAAINPRPGQQPTFTEIMGINVYGTWNVIHHTIPRMKTGVIINMGSLYGTIAPDPTLYSDAGVADKPIGYTVSKHAVHGITRHLAVRLAPNIRVNTLSPGGVWDEKQHHWFVDAYSDRVPLARMADVEDVVHAMIFLIENNYINGHDLIIDGGYSVC